MLLLTETAVAPSDLFELQTYGLCAVWLRSWMQHFAAEECTYVTNDITNTSYYTTSCSFLHPAISVTHIHRHMPLPLTPYKSTICCWQRWMLNRYQVILLGDRGTQVWTTCLGCYAALPEQHLNPRPVDQKSNALPVVPLQSHLNCDTVYFS